MTTILARGGIDAALVRVHNGFSSALGRGLSRVHHPDEIVFKYFLGAVALPGADPDGNGLLFGRGIEAFPSRRFAISLQGGAGEVSFAKG